MYRWRRLRAASFCQLVILVLVGAGKAGGMARSIQCHYRAGVLCLYGSYVYERECLSRNEILRPALQPWLLVNLAIQEVANEEAEKGEGKPRRKKTEKKEEVNED